MRILSIVTSTHAAMAALIGLASVGQAQNVIYVSNSGKNTWSGKLKAPNRTRTDGPKQTLEAAREAVRLMKLAQGASFNGATVVVRPGIYYRTGSFVIEEDGSGTPSAPVVYKAEIPGKTTLEGGRILTLVSPSSIYRNRLKPEVRTKVRQANIASLRLGGNPSLQRRGAFYPTLSSQPAELFWDSTRMPLAQWPNQGWAHINGDSATNLFESAEPLPSNWNLANAWVYGFFKYNWSDSYEKLNSVSPSNNMLTLATAPKYGIGDKQRFRVLNVLEELDSPGEYYVDPVKKVVLFYPPERSTARRVVLSHLDQPIIKLNRATNVRVEGFEIRHGRSVGIEIRLGSDVQINGCKIHSVGLDGISQHWSYRTKIDSCDIFDTGEGGIAVRSGDRLSLTPGNTEVLNCHITRVGQAVQAYRYGIALSGVGNIVRHCRIENTPHIAINFAGNNHLIELNEISSVCLTTGDSAAVYTGKDFSYQGSVIRKNLFHNIHGQIVTSSAPTEVYGVGLDDCGSGTTVEANIFKDVDFAVGIGGGSDVTVRHNVFEDTQKSVWMSLRPQSMWTEWGFQALLDAVNYKNPPYSTAYPHLVTFAENNPMDPKRNKVYSNAHIGATEEFLRTGAGVTVGSGLADQRNITVYSNYVGLDAGFIDPKVNDYRLNPGAAAANFGFQPLDGRDIGLYISDYRDSVPPLPGFDTNP